MQGVHLNENIWVVHPSCVKHAQVNKNMFMNKMCGLRRNKSR
jgi:hypothetical protein